MTPRSAILLLAHGTPDTLGEMAEYLGKVTNGRPMPAEVVQELQHRYGEIGLGETPGDEPPPLTKWTLLQARLLEAALAHQPVAVGSDNPAEPGTPVYVGMRNWRPYIADVIAQMRADGITRVKAICLAPQNSRTSVGLYRAAVLRAAEGLETEFVAGWAEHPLLAQAFAECLWPAWAEACAVTRTRVPVLFTAHSVPCRTISTGSASTIGARPGTPEQQTPDPYPVEAKRTATLVAGRMRPVGMRDEDWFFAFQSQGVSGGPWIGPSVEDTLQALAIAGHKGVVMQPVGFLCDHVEILYDIDIAFRETARELGLQLWRAQSLNASPTLIRALAEVATGHYRADVFEHEAPLALQA